MKCDEKSAQAIKATKARKKAYRTSLGFSTQGDTKDYFKAKDLYSVNWPLVESYNDRLVDIFEKVNSVITSDYKLNEDEIAAFSTKITSAYQILKETGIIQSDVADIVQMTLDNIAQELIEGRDIELRNFGVFEIKIRKSRKGRNPRDTRNEVIIPERAVVKFRAGKELKEAVEKLNPADFR